MEVICFILNCLRTWSMDNWGSTNSNTVKYLVLQFTLILISQHSEHELNKTPNINKLNFWSQQLNISYLFF